MPNKDLMELVCILDRSGSMDSIRKDAEGGFNSFIKDQRKAPGTTRVTLAQFDDYYELLHDNVPIDKVGNYKLEPRGMTALFDAIGKTMNTVGQRLSNTPEADRPSKILVVIVTDGEENHSREFKSDNIKEMIEHQKTKYSWQFLFLAANQDAMTSAGNIGIYTGNYINFAGTAKGVAGAYGSLSRAVACYSTSGDLHVDPYADDEDSQQLDPNNIPYKNKTI